MPNFLPFALCVLGLIAGGCRPDSASAPGQPAVATPGGVGLVFVPEGAPRPYFHDFGERLWGEQIETTYQLVNREGRAVIVHDLLPDCGCTRPRASVVQSDGSRVDGPLETRDMGLSVPDGATLEVRIGLDTTRVERANQHKLAQVRLRCDSDATPYLTFELHVLVKRSFRAVPAEAVLRDVPLSAGKSVRLDVTTENASDSSLVRGIESVEGPFHAELSETKAVSGETVWVIVVRADPGSNLGPHTGKVVLGTTRADGSGIGQNFEVPIRAVIVEDCVVEPRVIAIPREADGAAQATLHALIPGATVVVRKVRLDGGASAALRAEWEPIDADATGRAARWRITVRATAELPREAFSGKLVVELDDPSLPLVEAPYAAPPL
ncbi:MAG: hypothetical protein NTY35_16140 [Planctomycetota bacterium]|nr:hypothetical protein [Planctomycetota bacterium]